MNPKKKIGSRRPAYRDSKEDKAVKVYTINQESRYILVKGIPKISNITEEVLKPFSLYGAIQEYRILDDYPDAEEFTIVYWIKYVEILSARVAKRKMNNQSFYGSILKVNYGPEYEEVEDTRQKLIERRKAVATRLRNLGRNKETKDSHSVNSATSQESAHPSSVERPQSKTSLQSNHSDVRESKPAPSCEGRNISESSFPMLPPPPSHLPPSEWNDPSKMSARSSPDVASGHATLPAGYNPYVDGDSNSDQSNVESGSRPTNIYQKSIRDRNSVKYNEKFDKDSVEYFRPRKVPKEDMPTSSPWVFSGRRPEGGRRPSSGSQTDPSARGGARPKHVPRKRFAWSSEKRTGNIHGENSQQYLGQRLNPPPLPARNQFTEESDDSESRQTQEYQTSSHLNAGVKRKANFAFRDESGPSNYQPETSTDRSFNNSVLSIRAQLRQASEPSQANQNQHVTHSRQGSSLQNDSNRGMNESTSRGSANIQSVSADNTQTSRTRTAAIPGTVSQSQTSRQPSTTRRRI